MIKWRSTQGSWHIIQWGSHMTPTSQLKSSFIYAYISSIIRSLSKGFHFQNSDADGLVYLVFFLRRKKTWIPIPLMATAVTGPASFSAPTVSASYMSPGRSGLVGFPSRGILKWATLGTHTSPRNVVPAPLSSPQIKSGKGQTKKNKSYLQPSH